MKDKQCSNKYSNSVSGCGNYINPNHTYLIDSGYLYKDGEKIGEIIEKDGNKIKYKSISNNQYVNGTIRTIIIYP